MKSTIFLFYNTGAVLCRTHDERKDLNVIMTSCLVLYTTIYNDVTLHRNTAYMTCTIYTLYINLCKNQANLLKMHKRGKLKVLLFLHFPVFSVFVLK